MNDSSPDASLTATLSPERRSVVLQRLLRELRPYAFRIAFSALLSIVAGLGPLVYPRAFEYLTDVVLKTNHDGTLGMGPSTAVALWRIVGLVLVANIVANAALYGAGYLASWCGQRMVASLRVRLFARVLRLPLPEYDAWRPGEFLARFTSDLALMTDAANVSVPQLLQNSVTLIGAIAYMVVTDWRLTLFLLIFAPIVHLCVAMFTRLISLGDAARAASHRRSHRHALGGRAGRTRRQGLRSRGV